jgi:hypothetical protein
VRSSRLFAHTAGTVNAVTIVQLPVYLIGSLCVKLQPKAVDNLRSLCRTSCLRERGPNYFHDAILPHLGHLVPILAWGVPAQAWHTTSTHPLLHTAYEQRRAEG